nr:hypothetical protein [Streptomyces sp. wa22]
MTYRLSVIVAPVPFAYRSDTEPAPAVSAVTPKDTDAEPLLASVKPPTKPVPV